MQGRTLRSTKDCQRQRWNEQTIQGVVVMARQPSGLNDVTTTEELHHLLDSLIHKLLRGINDPGKYVDVAREHIEVVCSNVVNKLMDEPMMLELECPIAIVGDVHGQFIDLLRIFDRIGLPSNAMLLNTIQFHNFFATTESPLTVCFSPRVSSA
ncbi:Serine/threonine-protein phosphatase PP1 [Taenia crassiceps]|uniref:protein-serine/threonine phosphatase n=1 Tax=Taenia crassiceps TaxID=6207 RepID=A0ABR4QFQ9_9CEST